LLDHLSGCIGKLRRDAGVVVRKAMVFSVADPGDHGLDARCLRDRADDVRVREHRQIVLVATAPTHRDHQDFRRILGAADLGSDRRGVVEAGEEVLHPHVPRRLLETAGEIGAGTRTGTCHERDRSVPTAMGPPYRLKRHARRAETLELVEELLMLPLIHGLVTRQYRRSLGWSHPGSQ
jgi:hypothetical protein